jgi:hypothetical protein
MSDYSLDSLAYLKVILHAAKYPASTVTGLLVGTVTANKVTVQDAIPLLHHWTPLSPMMEAGLQLVRSLSPCAESWTDEVRCRRKCTRRGRDRCSWVCTSRTGG